MSKVQGLHDASQECTLILKYFTCESSQIKPSQVGDGDTLTP